MIDMDVLEAHGLTPDNLQKWLAIDPLRYIGSTAQPGIGGAVGAVNPPKDTATIGIQPTQEAGTYALSEEDRRIAMLQRHRSRIQESMTRNFADFRIYYAIDQAWDTPLRAISPTLIQSFLGRQDPNDEGVYKAMENFGLTHLIDERNDPKTGKKIKTVNLPMFFETLVPLVRSYVTIRWAKIMNDRRLTPFFKYDPVKLSADMQVKCDAITDRVQIMAQQYGYYDVMKQSVLHMLQYSFCFQFPKEEWDTETQLKEADEKDVAIGRKKEDGEPASVGDEIRIRVKEGLRYHHPHPSRIIRDLAHGPYTYNYDSGCEYGGYWSIRRYRDILNSTFWNKDKIALGTVDLISGNRLFFTTVFSACTLTSMPVATPAKTPDGPVLGAELGLGAGDLDRERQLATLYYGTQHGDQGVLVTEYFEKLIPKDNGLGTYDCPVWFRFLYAGDCCTVLYAAPLPYCPIIYYGYDADENRAKNAGLAHEILPFQDQFSNLLSQIIHTAKENLANLSFVDTDQLDETTLGRIRNMGDSYYRHLNIFPYSSRKAARGLNRVADVVNRYDLPKGNVAELINVMRSILDILERVLVMSSQEVAQAASHELRVDEVRNIAQSTSSRLMFTATPVDVAKEAWKRQLYCGLMGFGDPDWFVSIPAETPLTDDVLKTMGFEMDKVLELKPGAQHHYIRAKVKKEKTAMNMWEFASTRDGDDRMDNTKIAAALAQIIGPYLSNPMTAQGIGPDQAIEVLNRVLKLAGMPMDVKLRNVGGTPQQQQAQAQQQLQQTTAMILKAVDQELGKSLGPVEQVLEQLVKAVTGRNGNGGGAPLVPPEATVPPGAEMVPAR